MDKITLESQHITVEGHYGTWYAVDRMVIDNKPYYLLEHEKYGDEALAVIVNEDGTLIMEDVSDGLDQLPDFLKLESYQAIEEKLRQAPPSIKQQIEDLLKAAATPTEKQAACDIAKKQEHKR